MKNIEKKKYKKTLNPTLVSFFEKHEFYKGPLIAHLCAVYLDFEYKPMERKMIVEKNVLDQIYTVKNNKVTWKIPLFVENEADTGNTFDWVETEYIPMFKHVNNKKGGKVREATMRMKAMFKKNPYMRKNDVLNATKLYQMETNPNFIQDPHYFINKGVGSQITSNLLDYIDKYNDINKSPVQKTGLNKIIQ